jgi:hypothetical protein
MKGSVLVFAAESRVAVVRMTRHVSGLDAPSGEFDIIDVPCPDSSMGGRTRRMLELPMVQIADDEAETMLKYREVALALGIPETDPLKTSPFLLVSALRSRIEVSRFAKSSSRAKHRIFAVADLALDVTDEELGRVIVTGLAS